MPVVIGMENQITLPFLLSDSNFVTPLLRLGLLSLVEEVLARLDRCIKSVWLVE